MKLSHIEHIGIAVNSIEESLPYYEKILGLNCYRIEVVPEQGVKTAFLHIGEVKIELLEPTSEASPIAKFLEKKGPGIHHIAYAIEDGLSSALLECKQLSIRLIDAEPRNGAEGLKIAFLHPKNTQGVLTELCEK